MTQRLLFFIFYGRLIKHFNLEDKDNQIDQYFILYWSISVAEDWN